MKLGRNDPCSCGSGKKYKNCCLGKAEFHPLYSSAPTSDNLNQLDTLFITGHFVELENRARSLLKSYPDSGVVWKLLGLSLQMQGKDALPAMQKAAELLPNDAEAYGNLAAVLRARGQLDAAVASGRRALQIRPNFAEAHNNLGVALKDIGQLDEAVASYRRALEIKPDFVDVHNNLGKALKELGQFDDAVASYRRALKIKPDFVDAHNNLGNALLALRQLDDAVASYRRALEFKPDFAMAQGNLLSILNYTGHPTEYCLEEALKYGRMVAKKTTSRFSAWQCADQPERLRVGMVSGNLRNHPAGYFLEGLLAHIDPARVELIAYPTYRKEDELTARIRPYFSAWKPLYDKSDEAAARLIHADGVHVLLDLSGHSEHNRLPMFAWKPAPVQASWLDYFGTTGVAEMDYLLVDPYVVPHGEEDSFTETIWRLPESYLCFTEPAHPVDVGPLPVLTTGYITFGCFNKLDKMNDAVVDLWARVLQAVPDSRLFLKTQQLNDSMVRNITRQRFAERGISPERLLLEGSSPRAELLEAYHKVDIALDPFPYPGGTTSVEGLWMGVPVITRRGGSFLSRIGESISYNAGLADWIAADEDEYVAKAVEHTADLERLAALRAGLRQHVLASPIFDAPRFARNFETALWGMWQTWCDKQQKGKE